MPEPKFKEGDCVVLSKQPGPAGCTPLPYDVKQAFAKHKYGTVKSVTLTGAEVSQHLYFITFPGYTAYEYVGGVFECELTLAGPRDYAQEDEGGVV